MADDENSSSDVDVESIDEEEEELLFECRKCPPGTFFKALEKDAHRQIHLAEKSR